MEVISSHNLWNYILDTYQKITTHSTKHTHKETKCSTYIKEVGMKQSTTEKSMILNIKVEGKRQPQWLHQQRKPSLELFFQVFIIIDNS